MFSPNEPTKKKTFNFFFLLSFFFTSLVVDSLARTCMKIQQNSFRCDEGNVKNRNLKIKNVEEKRIHKVDGGAREDERTTNKKKKSSQLNHHQQYHELVRLTTGSEA